MAEVVSLHIFPVTGLCPVQLQTAEVTAAGLVGDRQFVLYDPKTRTRVSNKQIPELLTFSAEYETDGSLHVQHKKLGELVVPAAQEQAPFSVNEFGDQTPVNDAGNDAAEYFSNASDCRVRLARKAGYWMMGYGIPPADRKNAPIHMVSQDTIDTLQTGSVAFGADRFRANIVARGLPPLSELNAIGGPMRVGEADIAITRATQRCLVTGLDPATGVNLKDVPTLYKQFPRGPDSNKPTMGVYGYPLLPTGGNTVSISVGDSVTMRV